jgi:O-6-methylguanine DNA methyltransferase
MVDLWLEQAGSRWYGVARHEGKLVATVVAATREEADHILRGCLPLEAPASLVEEPSAEHRRVVRMLAGIEGGDETGKRFELSPAYVPEPLASVLCAAAAIPLGYVSTYGDIAAVAGTDARAVGKAMATNPLYPIVPCHRVVGSGYALVGYGGSSKARALRAKLARLRAEARGFDAAISIAAAGGLRAAPAEWAIARAVRDGVEDGPQLELW